MLMEIVSQEGETSDVGENGCKGRSRVVEKETGDL